MAGIQEPSKQYLSQLIGGVKSRIEVPSYQRSYSWTKDQAQDLLDDILRFEHRYPSDSIDSQEYFLGSIVGVRAAKTLRIIDGQQRLATLTVLASCLRDALAPLDEGLAGDLQKDLILEWVGPTKPMEPRLRLSDYDAKYFEATIQRFPPQQNTKAELASHKLIRQVRDYFDERLEGRLAALSDAQAKIEWLVRMWQLLDGSLVVVLVETQSEEDATEVFEVLNERGVGLSTLDLLRNFLLGRAGTSSGRDQIVDLWRDVYSISDSAPRIQAFLRHFWISRYGDVKSRGLYREIKHVLSQDFQKQTQTPVTFSETLSHSADTYSDIIAGSSGQKDLDSTLREIATIGAQALYPAILSSVEIHGTAGTAPVARSLLSHYVRWAIIGRREGTVLEQRVYDLAIKIRGGLQPEQSIWYIRDWFDSDKDFVADFAVSSLSRPGHRRHVLEQLERHLRKVAHKDELDLASAAALHVEHLYPQTPLAGQRLADHDDWVNRIGNLTLLGSRWNTSIRNGDFSTVKLPKLKESIILLNEWVTAQPSWGTIQIQQRQENLAKVAPDVWSLSSS